MKPDTILEALIGKIAKDEDCVDLNVKPETKLERLLERVREEFIQVPRPNNFVVGGYLKAISSENAVWVKPLTVIFAGTTTDGAFCSASFLEIKSAYEEGIPINAYYEVTSEDNEIAHYPLTMTKVYKDSELITSFVFSCRYTEPNKTDQSTGNYNPLIYGEVSCRVYEQDDYITIYADVPENSK